MGYYNNISARNVKKILDKISKSCDPYEILGYKVQTIMTAYRYDSCDQIEMYYGNPEDNFYIQEKEVYKRRIKGLDLSLEQWSEDGNYSNFVNIKIADTQHIVCDRLQSIFVPGDWEKVIDKLFKSSVAAIAAVDNYDWDFHDGITFNRENELVSKLDEIYDNSEICSYARRLCKKEKGEAVILDDQLILTKEIATDIEDEITTFYRIFTMGENCEEVYRVRHIENTGRHPYTAELIDKFRSGEWQEYILNYYDNMVKENNKANQKRKSK